ncbi:MAG: hypothetical protein SGPRY_001097 [Prymnesium sp.]
MRSALLLACVSCAAGLIAPALPCERRAGLSSRTRLLAAVDKPELVVCQASVCTKQGASNVLRAAKQSGFKVKPSSSCLSGCGKGVNVKAKGLGKRMLRDCTDPAKAKASVGQIAKQFGC